MAWKKLYFATSMPARSLPESPVLLMAQMVHYKPVLNLKMYVYSLGEPYPRFGNRGGLGQLQVNSLYVCTGMNKMVINHLEKLFVTSDAATVIRELEVEHPAARMIVMATKMMEQEVRSVCQL